jgi:dUTP pyrophosphatase
VKVILINLGQDAFTVAHGMRIAQLIIAPITYVQLQEADALDETGRGRDGFGSSGIR